MVLLRKRKVAIILFLVCAVIYLFPNSYLPAELNLFNGLFETTLFLWFLTAWGLSLMQRIPQPASRRSLVLMSNLMGLWILLRFLKFYIFMPDTAITRHLWYGYYISILPLPSLALYAVICMGHSDDYHFYKLAHPLCLITCILIALVLTNDLHELVFIFPPELLIRSDSMYSYGPIYTIIFCWITLCSTTATIFLIRRCRIPGSRRLLWSPLVPLGLFFFYILGYALGIIKFLEFMTDLTVVSNLFIVIIWETCIKAGLIRVNTDYDLLFKNGSFGAQIFDDDWNLCFTSQTAHSYPEELMKATVDGLVMADPNTRLQSSRIKGGRVLWVTDISALNTVLEQLEENRKNLAERVTLQQETVRTKMRITSAREKNRLYIRLWTQTAKQISELDDLLTACEKTEDLLQKRRILGQVAVIGAYIKRRGNLLLITELQETMDSEELILCLEESLANLELSGIVCGIRAEAGHAMACMDVLRLYGRFEAVLETVKDELSALWLVLRFDNQPCLHMELETTVNLSDRLSCGDCHEDHGVWTVNLHAGKENGST